MVCSSFGKRQSCACTVFVSYTNANPMHPMQGLALVTTMLSVYPDRDLDLE